MLRTVGKNLCESCETGTPVRIMPISPHKGSGTSYWKIPLIRGKDRTVIGFIDCRKDNSGAWQMLRYSLAADDSQVKANKLLSMTRQEVFQQARSSGNADVDERVSPQLVFDRAETRVGWKCTLSSGDTVIVTANYAYPVPLEASNDKKQ